MGGCIICVARYLILSIVSSLHGRVYRVTKALERACKSFLPTWEGVSQKGIAHGLYIPFPPYMGGCIVGLWHNDIKGGVSSLHGRVYRLMAHEKKMKPGFLPTWEGVSVQFSEAEDTEEFPPYTGGCIAYISVSSFSTAVSSLYGRVYRPFLG